MGIIGIILTTFRETVRQPSFVVLIALGATAVVVSVWLPFFTLQSETDTDMYQEMGLAFVLVFSLLAGLLAAATGIAREVEAQVVQTVLSKAVARWKYVVGKYLGVVLAMALAVLILGTVLVGGTYHRVAQDAGVMERSLTRGGVGEEVEAFQRRQANQALTMLPGVVTVFLQVSVMVAVATALSTRLPPAAAVGFSLAIYLAGHLTHFLGAATRTAEAGARAAAQGGITVLPFLEAFNLDAHLAHAAFAPLSGEGPGWDAMSGTWAYVGWSAVYAAGYIVFALGLGALLFRRRSLG